ncbi:hypothetical protein GCM10011346_40510 [Oceanobacillus neutriphilus]|uniref:Uncharacterized protein n=1 Tax=Oceanobacillus neutriphilus TaxID=531815 RepID=A0ABQ2P025_9BACI|nr:hypothetical protein GCM10011346_40510 [Oceanobacillus neutriphilus]
MINPALIVNYIGILGGKVGFIGLIFLLKDFFTQLPIQRILCGKVNIILEKE